MAATQSVQLSRADADAVESAAQSLRAERYIARLWERDASLWTSDPAAQASIRDRLGWLTIASAMRPQVGALQQFAQEVRASGLTRAVLLGMGGSSLFSDVCRRMFGPAAGALDLTVLDTTDPAAIRAQHDGGPLKQLLVIVSSKSGSTAEITALSAYFSEALAQAGCEARAQNIAITDEGTPLARHAAAQRFRRLFAHGRGTGADVGGRFSALTYFGPVPAALMGIDAAQLLRRGEEMLARCGPARAAAGGPGAPLDENPAVQLGAVLGALAQAGRDKATLLCSPPLDSVGTWLEQLIAESTGKQGRGIAPIHGEPVREPSGYGDDRVFIELQLASEPDRALQRSVDALAKAGQPVVRIRWDDRYDLGGETAKWCVATTIAARLLGVNPFDEPNVQESKDRTKALLAQYVRDGRLPPIPEAPGSMSRRLSVFLAQRRARDYVAVLSFLPRVAALDAMLEELRGAIGRRCRCATMTQVGPRYFHSSGQLFKGGPDAGLFLLLTAEETRDLAIPGERVTFGILKQAQALGDVQAMQERGRRLLHLHLPGEPERALQQFVAAVGR